MIYFIILILVIFLLIYFSSAKTGGRRVKSTQGSYKKLLREKVVFYQNLNNTEKINFEKRVTDFLEETHIEGIGTEITELDRVLIASSAIIPVFGFAGWKYKNLSNVIMYPNTFDKEFQFEGNSNRSIMGMVGSGYMNGQMLLSRAALYHGFSKSSGNENVAIHEFVHLLDKSDGNIDGIPENLQGHQYAIPWLRMMQQEMNKIEKGKSDINPYALTNEAEFLAVVSEYFFSRPEKFKDNHPELYEQLSLIFDINLIE